MTEHEPHMHHLPHATFATYAAGFAFSILFTIAAFFTVTSRVFTWPETVTMLLVLALMQLAVQVICFLHVDLRERSRWNLTALAFTVLIVGVVVIGSLWIMTNLDYNMMSLQNNDNYMLKQEGLEALPHATEQ